MVQSYTPIDPRVTKETEFFPEGTTTFEVGKAFASEAFAFSTPQMAGDYLDGILLDAEPITESQWNDSEWFRPGLKFNPKMTKGQSRVLAERFDQRERNKAVIGRATSAQKAVAFLPGAIAGSLPDPINFIPFLGAAGRIGISLNVGARTLGAVRVAGALDKLGKGARAFTVGKLGVVGTRAAISATEAGLAELAAAPLLFEWAESMQEDIDASMLAMNIAFGMGIGGAFGTIGGFIGRRSEKFRTDASMKAIQDLADERPVDVTEALGSTTPLSDQIRRALNDPLEGADIPANAGLARDIVVALNKSGVQRTLEERALLNSIDLPPEFAEVAKILGKPPGKRTPQELDFVKAFSEGAEAEFIQDRLAKSLAALNELNEKIGARKIRPANLLEKRSRLERQVRADQARLDEINRGQAPDFSTGAEEITSATVEAPQKTPVLDAASMTPEEITGLENNVKSLQEAQISKQNKADIKAAEENLTKSKQVKTAWTDAAVCLMKP